MLVTNGTGRKIRISQFQAINEDEEIESFAWILGKGTSLSIDLTESFTITLES